MDKGLKFYDIGDTQGSQYEYSDYTQDNQLGDKDENDFTLDSLTQATEKESNEDGSQNSDLNFEDTEENDFDFVTEDQNENKQCCQ